MSNLSTKTPKGSSDGLSVDLYIYSALKSGKTVTRVAKERGVSKQYISKRLKTLKAFGIIEKKGFGVWEVDESKKHLIYDLSTKKLVNQIKLSASSKKSLGDRWLTSSTKKEQIAEDTLRSHAFGFRAKVKSYSEWTKLSRRKYLRKKGIDFTEIHQGESLVIDGARVWLTNVSIVVWLGSSYFVDSADMGYNHAVLEMKDIIRKVERMFGISGKFAIKGKYHLKIFRQHHAMVKNALATHLNKSKEKLYVFDERGLWLLVDNSEDLGELEVIAEGDRAKEGVGLTSDAQSWWNDLKGEGFPKLSDLVNAIHQTVTSLKTNSESVDSQIMKLSLVMEKLIGFVHNSEEKMVGIEKTISQQNMMFKRIELAILDMKNNMSGET